MALWTIALDKDGKRVNIENAPKGEKYTCINCFFFTFKPLNRISVYKFLYLMNIILHFFQF